MDKNILKQAAKHHAYNNYDRSYRDRQEGFEACGEWFMQQPLADRLTDEEKETIIKAYTEAKQDSTAINEDCQMIGSVVVETLESLFGKEIFSK